MNPPEPARPTDPTPDRLEELLRARFDADAASVRPDLILNRLKPVPTTPSTRRRKIVRRLSGFAVAASVAVVFGWLMIFAPQPTPVLASPQEILRDVSAAHTGNLSHHYDVTTEWEPWLFRTMQLPALTRDYQLWTRSDQFFIQATTERNQLILGQESPTRVWCALNQKRGLILDANEPNEPLVRLTELLSMRMVTLLADLLERFELFREDSGSPDEPIRIRAMLRPNARNPMHRSIRLEIDPKSKIIRFAELQRIVNDQPAGAIRFVYRESSELAPELFTLRGHLDADAEILDRNDPQLMKRRAQFREDFLKRLQSRVK